MKLHIHLKSLSSRGGAERAMLGLARELANRGHKVTISVCQARGAHQAYPVPEGIDVIWLRSEPVPWYLQPLNYKKWLCQRALKQHLAQTDYDVVLGWLRYGAAKVGQLPRRATRALRGAAIRNVPFASEPPPFGKLRGMAMHWRRRAGYTGTDRVFVQMPQFYDMLPKAWQAKTVVIPNAVTIPDHPLPAYESREKLIIAVARLVPVKRHDALIRGFALFREKFPDWRLEIWGQDGPKSCRPLLDTLIERHGLQDCVALMGVTDDIEAVYARARIMAHPSVREGMSNSVTEAMARALPVIANTDCTGMDVLINNDKNGLMLAGDSGAEPLEVQICAALTRLASDPGYAEDLGRMALQHVQDNFAPSVVYDQWEAELMRPVNSAPRGQQTP